MENKSLFTNYRFVALVATLCCILWGSAYPAIKIGYVSFQIMPEDIASKFVFAGYRFVIAGIALLLVARAFGIKIFALTKSNMANLVVLGLVQTTLQYIFFYIGVANTTGVKGSIMNSTVIFFSVILAHYLYKNDKLTKDKIIGCLMGFIGVVIVNFSTDLLNFSFRLMGEGFVVIAAFVFSVAGIHVKKITKSMDVIVVTGYSLLIGGIVLTILGFVCGGTVDHFTTASSAILLYLALLSSVAFSLWNLLLKYNKFGQVSVYNFLTPIFGAILSAIFLGESILEVKNIIALILVSLGIWMVNKEKKPQKLYDPVSVPHAANCNKP